jgi:hemerythrin-like domain-containing protein
MAKGGLDTSPQQSRRRFVTLATAGSLAPVLLAGCHGEKEEEVSTNEDLMREHGVLKRVLLAYEEVIRRVHAGQDFPAQSVIEYANIIRKFIEDDHEKLEEDYLFPRFRKAGKLTDLVDTLQAQH